MNPPPAVLSGGVNGHWGMPWRPFEEGLRQLILRCGKECNPKRELGQGETARGSSAEEQTRQIIEWCGA